MLLVWNRMLRLRFTGEYPDLSSSNLDMCCFRTCVYVHRRTEEYFNWDMSFPGFQGSKLAIIHVVNDSRIEHWLAVPMVQGSNTMIRLEKSRSQRILWLLEELKLDYELKTFKRSKDMLAPQELKDIHPLGKSPVIKVEAPAAPKPLIIAESAFIIEYLAENFGSWLVPKKYVEGKEGQIGGESEEWLRYRFFMHYGEGSLMTYMIVSLLMSSVLICLNHCCLGILILLPDIKNSPVPFFIKPITGMIAGRVDSMFLQPNFKTHFSFLESQISSSPNGGEYLCGKELSGADILLSFPLIAARGRAGLNPDKYPKLCAYIDRLQERDAHKRAVEKIIEVEGSYSALL